jgi:hypothetical protein
MDSDNLDLIKNTLTIADGGEKVNKGLATAGEFLRDETMMGSQSVETVHDQVQFEGLLTGIAGRFVNLPPNKIENEIAQGRVGISYRRGLACSIA